MEEAPSPLEIKKFVPTFEHKMKYNGKNYKIKFNSSYEDMEVYINEEDNSISKNIYSNIFSLKQLNNISNYFKMFDKIDDLLLNLKTLIEENKYQLSVKDKSLIINFSPGIIIKGKIELGLLLKEKSQDEQIKDLIELTQSLLKRVDNCEKENAKLKLEIKELKEKLNEHINQKELNYIDIFKDSIILTN